MIFIVADSSALMSLVVTDIFKFSKGIEFKISRGVYNEINLIKNYKDKEGSNANKILRNLKEWDVEVLNIKDKQKLNILLKDPLIDKGEAESFILALEEEIEDLITDDLKAISVLNKYNQKKININSSIIIPAMLYASDKISRNQARKFIIRIAKYRKWDDELFKESLESLEKFKKKSKHQ